MPAYLKFSLSNPNNSLGELMKKLKLIIDRKNENANHLNDLRGVDQEFLLGNAPEPILYVKIEDNVVPPEIEYDFGLKSNSHKGTLSFSQKIPQANYKLGVLTMLYFLKSLEVTHVKLHSAHLHVHDRLAEKMHAAMEKPHATETPLLKADHFSFCEKTQNVLYYLKNTHHTKHSNQEMHLSELKEFLNAHPSAIEMKKVSNG